MDNQYEIDKRCLEQVKQALRSMRASKPDERSEKARRYAVSITEMEKVLAYFRMYVVDNGASEE